MHSKYHHKNKIIETNVTVKTNRKRTDAGTSILPASVRVPRVTAASVKTRRCNTLVKYQYICNVH